MDYIPSAAWAMIIKELDALGDLADEDLIPIPETIIIGEATEY